MRRIPLIALVLALAALALPVTAHAQGGTSAVATNTKDGSDIFRLAFQIRHVMGDTVDQQNAAVAYASCDACQTTAISIQVLLIGGDPSTFTPENYAIAWNQDCTACDTLASAYQFVTGGGSPLHFTADGNRRIADIRRQLQSLRNSGLSGPETQAQVDSLMTQLQEVLQTETVAGGPPQGGPDAPSSSQTDGSAGTAPQDASPPPSDSSPSTTTPSDTTPSQTAPPDTASTTPAPGTDTGTGTTPAPSADGG